MKRKLLLLVLVMLSIGFSSVHIPSPMDQQFDIAHARSMNESASKGRLLPHLFQSAHAAHNASTNTSVEEHTSVRIISCYAVAYGNEQQLLDASDLVVKGQVIEKLETEYVKGKYYEYSTPVMLEISEVYKGEHTSGDIIEVTQMGGFDGEVNVISHNTTYLEEEQEAVLFLKMNNDGKYRSINESDGVYVLENGFYMNKGNNRVLDNEFLD